MWKNNLTTQPTVFISYFPTCIPKEPSASMKPEIKPFKPAPSYLLNAEPGEPEYNLFCMFTRGLRWLNHKLLTLFR